MKSFILMIQFLTQIPILIDLKADEEDFRKGIFFFALVGVIIGGILYISFDVLIDYFNEFTVAVILVVLEILLTGGLHLDGLADTADGLFSNRSKERILEIMKDSRVGSNGVLALLIFILLKTVLILEVIDFYSPEILFLMPIVSRGAVTRLFYKVKYARKEGMGNLFIEKATAFQVQINLYILIIVSALIHYEYILLIIPVYLFNELCKIGIMKKIDGITGDVIGFLIELDELVYLMAIVLLTRIF